MDIFFLILNLVFALLVFFLTIAFITGAPFVPSGNDATKALIRLANVRHGMKFYDLGSGDGRLLFEAAKKGAIAYGIEINPFLVILTYVRVLFSPYRSNIHVRWGNFWNADYKDADILCIYLLPWRMEKLEALLLEKTKKGTIIVSNSFIFPHLKQIDHDEKTHSYAFQT
jgi:SAM-dependent methyltransferase